MPRIHQRRDDHVDVRACCSSGRTSRRRTPAPCPRIDGLKLIAPRRCSPSPGRQVKSGSRSTARLTLPELPRNLNRRISCSNSGSRLPGSRRSRKVTLASAEDRTTEASISSPLSSATPVARPLLDDDPGDGRLGADLRAQGLGRTGDRVGHAAGAALGDAPGAEGAVDLAHVVVQQHVRGTGRPDALVGADDPRRGHRGLERVRLEPLLEEVRGRHRHQLDEHRLLALRQLPEAAHQAGERHQRARVVLGRVRGHDPQDRLDEAGHLDHELAVFLVRLGVVLRPAAQLADRAAVVVHAPQVVAAARLRALARAAAA